MAEMPGDPVRRKVDEIYRVESRRVLATLIRLLGDFDLAEEAMQEAFAAAVEQWGSEGFPANPRAWLISAGRFKGTDRIRREARQDSSLRELASTNRLARTGDAAGDAPAVDGVEDDRLRLIFTCCHPALSAEAQVALTLREVCGLSTEAIASAFLVAAPTLAQRIVRAKHKIRTAGIPFDVPELADLPKRLASVLSVIYLVFNEGYSASSGESATRPDLSAEAIRLGRLLVQLLPAPEPEAMGLLGLMLLHESRRAARTTPDGGLVLLEEQDRSLWNRRLIEEGIGLVERTLASRRTGPYAIQAAIAAVHAEARSADQTDWPQIAGLYDVLLGMAPTPVIELNRAVAVAMRDGPDAGLRLIDAIFARGDLRDYHLAHAARADLLRRLNRSREAIEAYHRALQLARQEPERQFLAWRIDQTRSG